ncbi:unnamed protein product, partial [Gadus morhua 'NCC']
MRRTTSEPGGLCRYQDQPSTTKWNRLCMAEKKRFTQIEEKTLFMESLGLSFTPAFKRRKKPGQVRVCSPEETDSEEEELWTSGLTGAGVWEPPTVRQGSLQQPSTSDAVSVQSLSGQGRSDQEVSGRTIPAHPETDPTRGGAERGSAVQEEVSLVIYQKPEAPKEDDYFFCDECRTFFREECEVHGPILFMADRPVAVGEKDRAKKTLPAGFEIRDPGIPGAGLGVFYCGDGGIPIGTHFGPYEGHRTDEEGALESGYSWEIYKSRHNEYIDARRETHSNWMRYVKCARNEEEQNLIAFQCKGGILYRSCCFVTSGEELLVWYGDEYARHLGIGFDQLWSSTKGGKSQLTPAQSQIFLHRHMKRSHGDLNDRQLKSGEIKNIEDSVMRDDGAAKQDVQMNPMTQLYYKKVSYSPYRDRIPLQIVRAEVELSAEERAYLTAVEKGDYAGVKHALREAEVYYNMDVNCLDPLGRSSLLIAIENENLEVMELLLDHGVHTGDALLYAIRKEVVGAVELLLNHRRPSGEKQVPSLMMDSQFSEFTPDITPIMLAAHTNNYEIIKLLVQRKVTIPRPHQIRCDCVECVSSSEVDSLRHSRSRLNIYKALASPSLIALSSEDPILTAFRLGWELKELSKVENEFRQEYEELSQQCKLFAKDLLDQARSSRELETILNHRDSDQNEELDLKLCHDLAKLKLAIKYHQKEFVSQPNCQQLLATLWYDGFPGWRRRHWVVKLVTCVIIGLLFPVFSMIYLLAPKSALGTFIKKPFIKFICHTASYLTFLFLLLLASQHIARTNLHMQGPPPTLVEWMILPWVVGFIWAEIKEMWDGGFTEYIHDWWNLMDFAMNSLYLATISLKIVAYVKYNSSRPREEWEMWHPTLIAEALFAIANIFSSLRLISLFTANSHLGPLQISLGRMLLDILKFLFIYCL